MENQKNIETEKYTLIPISRNRYRISMKPGYKFTKQEAKRIRGCYFSGNQMAWVFPITKVNIERFRLIFNLHDKHLITGDKSNSVKEALPHICIDKTHETVGMSRNYSSESIELENEVINEFKRLKFSYPTIKTYTLILKKFINFHKPLQVQNLSNQQIRDYLIYLVRERNFSAYTQNQVINALKFYYGKVYKRTVPTNFLPRPKKVLYQPTVLSEVDVVKILKSIENIKHKCIISLIYSSGLWPREVIYLKLRDIDSEKLRLFISSPKGSGRYVLLSRKMLELLRSYYKNYKPVEWLFEGEKGGRYSTRSIQHIFSRALRNSEIAKYATLKTLRNSFAVHLLDKGTDVRYIQKLLGHKNIKTTYRFLRVSKRDVHDIESPLDSLDFS